MTDSFRSRSPRARGLGPVLLLGLGVVLLGSIVYLLVLAFGGAKFFKVALPTSGVTVVEHDARPWLLAAAGAAVLSLVGWALALRRAGALAGAADAEQEARAEQEEILRRLRRSEADLGRVEHERDEERASRERTVDAWHRERDWNRELRKQIAGMQREHGVLGRHDDVRETVLELTMSLVQAEKGILLSEREDPGGKLKVVCSLGFDSDPRDSGLAQRFATEVIERDRTVREDDAARVAAEKPSAADREVRNLLAIPIYLSDDFAGVIVCVNRDGGFETLDDDVLLAVGDHAGAVLQNSRLHGDLRNAYLGTIRVLANAIELKDPELRGHSDAVSDYVLAVADRLGFEPERREALIFASLLHDVGKLGISERILLKPAGLTPEERSVIQLHPRLGYQLIRQVAALESLAPAVLHHHERFDGDGYPGRLAGEAIPLEARIIAIADAFSAMTSQRPYSPAGTPEEACLELERCAGGQFDPEVVRMFVEEVRRRPETPVTRVPLDPELGLHRAEGEFVLGARSFGITDSLTLLYSHRHFHETARAHAQRAAIQGCPFAVILIRLVELERINRSLGFGEGDAALQSVAAIVARSAAGCQGVAFRESGRTIALIAPGVDQSAADRLAAVLDEELRPGPGVMVAAAAWQTGEDGRQVIERAQRAVKPSALPAHLP
ncbi:MAG: HD domain-containing protein [Actinomycetota bacterium]|nr:HD domain-containing protein [Actinomycetota bacterium]